MEKEIIKYSYIHGVSITQKNQPTEFPPHWHTSAEFTLIRKKGCIYRIGDEIFHPDPGDIMLVWPRELHEIVHAPKNGYMLVQFSSALTENNSDIASAIRFMVRYRHVSSEKDPVLAGRISDYMKELSDIFESSPYFAETKCKLVIYQMLLLIGQHVINTRRELIGSEFSDAAWGYIQNACSFISEHSSDDISQTDVAAAVGLSPFYFSKIFREYTQMSFPSYLADMRVQNAISLLADPKYSITDCAFMSGFQSTTTFNKAFRESTGCSPREFRRMESQKSVKIR